MPYPVYLSYADIPKTARAKVKRYKPLEENDYQIDIDEAQRLINERTEMVAIASPGSASFLQYAATAAIRCRDGSVEKMRREFRALRDYLVRKVDAIKHFSCAMPKVAFYVFMNIKKTGMDSPDFCDCILRRYRLALVPGEASGESGRGFCRNVICCCLGNH